MSSAAPGTNIMSVPDRIRRWANERPDAIAAVDEDGVLSYGELDRRAGRLAAALHDRGLGPERIAGICMPPSVDLVVAILAVWGAGAAYVAIDPSWPALRRRELLAETDSTVVLVNAAIADEFTATPHRPIVAARATVEAAPAAPPFTVPASSLAYVLYTSGSTGRPKGVMIEHRHLAAYVQAAIERYEFPPAAHFLLSSTFAADLGHTPIFCALSTGGTLHLVSPALATDADGLSTYVQRHGIDVMKMVPSHLMTLVGAAREPAALMPRTHVVLGGEPLHHEVVDALRRRSPSVVLINEYGPTETTVGVIAAAVTAAPEPQSQTVPAGFPLRGSTASVLTERFEPVAGGQTGELYIGGATVGRGYWRDPASTAERFLPDPTQPGGRMYRTGDGARRLADGASEIVGRLDSQVKIRGFRVEPTEVEACLLRCAGVHGAVVEAESRQDRTLGLVAYAAVGEADVESARQRIIGEVEARLPSAMVPTTLVLLKELPLTANGKVDRGRLRSLPRGAAHAYIAPETEAERALASVWSQVLNVQRIGRHDSFFRLGGDSILMIRASTLATRLGYRVSPRTMFRHPVLADLARAIETGADSTRPTGGDAAVPLS